jgi:hypothetical protein
LAPCILPPTAGKPTDGADGHVVVAQNLAAQPDAGQLSSGQYVAFRDGHARWFAGDELDAARGAAGMSAAGVKLIDSGVLCQGQDKPLPSGNVEFADIFNR